jgi:predicted small secreted protein
MNWKSFIVGAISGVAAGYFLKEELSNRTFVPAEKVLQQVKQAFKKNGTIDGSWVHMKPETYDLKPLETKIYRGGVSSLHDGKRQQYEFIANAFTGSIIDIRQV